MPTDDFRISISVMSVSINVPSNKIYTSTNNQTNEVRTEICLTFFLLIIELTRCVAARHRITCPPPKKNLDEKKNWNKSSTNEFTK